MWGKKIKNKLNAFRKYFGTTEVIRCGHFKEGEILPLNLKEWAEIYNVENRRGYCFYQACSWHQIIFKMFVFTGSL